MGFYDDHVLPHIMNWVLDRPVRNERRRCLGDVRGKVVEIGFGSGLNLPFYPGGVTHVVGVDPAGTAARLAGRRIASAPFSVETIRLSAEKLPAADASFDSAVSTFTLCTIPDVALALRELHRVLLPGGRLHFVEHGLADDANVARWQGRLNGVQQTLFGGCNLNRPMSALVEQAGFEIERLDRGYLKDAPRFIGFLYRGVARRT